MKGLMGEARKRGRVRLRVREGHELHVDSGSGRKDKEARMSESGVSTKLARRRQTPSSGFSRCGQQTDGQATSASCGKQGEQKNERSCETTESSLRAKAHRKQDGTRRNEHSNSLAVSSVTTRASGERRKGRREDKRRYRSEH
ncbi:hypothetical protein TRVL_03012 [Trypanosoma vivax]|nr:hypothetical protein TRVL_03012 [Trypanosoma vivax]